MFFSGKTDRTHLGSYLLGHAWAQHFGVSPASCGGLAERVGVPRAGKSGMGGDQQQEISRAATLLLITLSPKIRLWKKCFEREFGLCMVVALSKCFCFVPTF